MSDYGNSVAIAERVTITADGTTTVYEVHDPDLRKVIFASANIDEVLAFTRGYLTGQEE